MAGMAISVLWFLIGLIILCGIIYLAIWVIVLLLALIALIGALMGGTGFHFPSLR